MKLTTLALTTLLMIGSAWAKDETDFPLYVHIISVDVVEGLRGVTGVNGNVGGGGSYVYHVFTVHIDGDNREIALTTPKWRGAFKKGYGLSVGDYRGHWNKNGSLEIAFHPADKPDKILHETFYIYAEHPLPPPPPAK